MLCLGIWHHSLNQLYPCLPRYFYNSLQQFAVQDSGLISVGHTPETPAHIKEFRLTHTHVKLSFIVVIFNYLLSTIRGGKSMQYHPNQITLLRKATSIFYRPIYIQSTNFNSMSRIASETMCT